MKNRNFTKQLSRNYTVLFHNLIDINDTPRLSTDVYTSLMAAFLRSAPW
jgi:hypothetical protein